LVPPVVNLKYCTKGDIMNNGKIERLGIMLDASRNAVMKPQMVKKYIDLISKMGYNCLMLYIEDTYEIKGRPYFGLGRGRYTQAELKEIDDYAYKKGIEVIPCIQCLAHLERIFRWPEFGKLNDIDNILLVDNEETYKFIGEMIDTVTSCFRSRVVNIGFDEAMRLGRGKYLDKHGYRDRIDIMSEHLQRICDMAKERGLELLMWGDMYFGTELFTRMCNNKPYDNQELLDARKNKEKIPEGVSLVYWDYYSTRFEVYDLIMETYNYLKPNSWFAGGLWTWTGFAPRNQFSIYTTKLAIEACYKNGIKNVVMTMWGDNGSECSKFNIIPSLFYTAQLAQGITDETEIKNNFKQMFGIEFQDFMLLDLKGTQRDCEDDCCVTSDNYLLYNDVFIGLYDALVPAGENEKYGALVPKLQKLVKHSEYGYLFETMTEFCKVMSIKVELGCKTRKAYLEKDIDALKALVADYETLPILIDGFYEAYERQWMYENKPQGFEVQDIRLGGLARRIEHCKKMLVKYIEGEIDSIPELEEDRLDPKCRTGEEAGTPIFEINWSKIATSSNMG